MKKIVSRVIISCFLLAGLAGCSSKDKQRTLDSTANELSSTPDTSLIGDQSKQTALLAYMDVMLNKVQLITTSYAESGTKTIYLNQLLKEGADSFQFINFAVLDMDGDKIDEVVIQYSLTASYPYPDYVEVLHYREGTVYGYNFSYRGLYGLKNDGSFMWSNAADDNGYATLQFPSYNWEYVNIAYNKPNLNNEPYVINYQTVTKSDYDTFIKSQEEKEDVIWYEFNEENIKAQLLGDNK